MTCCQCQGAESLFSGFYVKRELKSYRRKGPRKTTRFLIESVKARGIAGATLLDVGGGVGAIQHELLKAGAARATGADAASAYVRAVEEEARRQGHADRVLALHGDFVELADQVEPADVVTLDRVICCYPNMESLVRLSAQRARRTYALVYPRNTWLTRAGHRALNLFFWLTRNPFRVFVHATADVDRLIRADGLRQVDHHETLTWQVAVYVRAS
jgi:magnesium-protoporphyrin O-methyltransferase